MRGNSLERFIAITSSAVKQPVDSLLLSNSVRAALTGSARTLANEYAPYGITMNNVCQRYTRTARLDHLAKSISVQSNVKSREVFTCWAREIPTRRIGMPEKFAAAVVFLGSQRASYVSGTSIAVDAGLVRGLL